MIIAEELRRPRPALQFDGPEHVLDVNAALLALRAEPHPGARGHRQITILHHGPVRLVLVAFEAGGRMPAHQAPGWVTIHVLRGSLHVHTAGAQHVLGAGQILALAPGVPHDVDAISEADMLLGVYPGAPTR